jgi:hypothetical protein
MARFIVSTTEWIISVRMNESQDITDLEGRHRIFVIERQKLHRNKERPSHLRVRALHTLVQKVIRAFHSLPFTANPCHETGFLSTFVIKGTG